MPRISYSAIAHATVQVSAAYQVMLCIHRVAAAGNMVRRIEGESGIFRKATAADRCSNSQDICRLRRRWRDEIALTTREVVASPWRNGELRQSADNIQSNAHDYHRMGASAVWREGILRILVSKWRAEAEKYNVGG